MRNTEPVTSTTPKVRPGRLVLAAVLSASLLSGCGVSEGRSPAGAPGGVPTATGGSTPDPGGASGAAVDGFPTCAEVKAALGAEVDALVELDPDENGVTVGAEGPSLACSWFTEDTAGSSIDMVQYGGISIGISRDPEYTEESMASLGWNVDDARVAAAGAWALKVGGGYDPADQLDATGVQVVRDGVVVVLTSGGLALQDVPQLAALTNDWALGAGVALLALVE